MFTAEDIHREIESLINHVDIEWEGAPLQHLHLDEIGWISQHDVCLATAKARANIVVGCADRQVIGGRRRADRGAGADHPA